MEYFDIAKIIILLTILAILGFNIFTYLAKGTDIFGIFLKKTSQIVGNVVGKTLQYSEIGTKKSGQLVGETIKTVGSAIDSMPPSKLQKAVEKGPKISKKFPSPSPAPPTSIQEPNKKGACYIGTDRGIRSCIKVRESNMCMSGEIFPTMSICIHPKLRQ